MPYSSALDELFDDVLSEYFDDPIVWCVRPILAECASGRRHASAYRTYARHLGAIRPLGHATGVRTVAGVTVIADTVNHHRVLDPLVDALVARSDSMPEPCRPLVDPRYVMALTVDAHRLTRRLAKAAASAGLSLDSTEVLRRSLGAARALARARSCLSNRPAVVVVASQAAPHIRAFLWEARRLTIPTVYVPHAPVARTRTYADLPVDYAALRGEAEVRWYRDLGVSEGLAVVGNPGMAAVTRPQIDLQSPALLAVSPQDREQLRAVIELASRATAVLDLPVLVAPHPRQDVGQLRRLCPPAWDLAPIGATTALLEAGPWCVMQSSSGVAWEALARGLPTIQLSPHGEAPPYPLISAPAVSIATDVPSVVRAISDAQLFAADESKRNALVAHAKQWCSIVGGVAIERLVSVVDAAAKDGGRTELLNDAWFAAR